MRRIVRSRKGVSPVIATLLMITLSIAAATTISIVLSNFDEDTSTASSDSYNLGTTSDDSINVDLDSSIIKLSIDSQLAFLDIVEYTELSISVEYTGSLSSIYVIDFDIIVFGQKMDDISLWTITDASNAFYTTVGGNFAGFRQNNGTTATYTVQLSDINEKRARIPDQTSFTYEIKIGKIAGQISEIIQKTHEARTIFNAVFYNVAILHHGTINTVNSAAWQYDQTLTTSTLNGTNRLFFLYNKTNDSYNYNSVTLNATELSQDYDIVIVDKWAVPTIISDVLTFLHENGTRLIFYGDLLEFGTSISTVQPLINNTATEEIIGVIPSMYDPNVFPGGGGWKITENGYSFTSDPVGLLLGLQGAVFDEQELLPGWVQGDSYGLDAATLTAQQMPVSVYGTSRYSFSSLFGGEYYAHQGPMLVVKEQQNNLNGRSISYIWKTREQVGSAIVVDLEQLDRLRRNMISAIISEDDRLANTQPAEISIDGLYTIFPNVNDNTEFDLQVQATVTEGNIANGTLVISIDMPDMLNFSEFWLLFSDISIYFNGSIVTNNLPVDLNTGNVINVDIGSIYAPDIPQGTVITMVMPRQGNIEFNLDQEWLQEENWRVTATFDIAGYSTRVFPITLNAVDTTPPGQVTGVTTNVISDTQIDLSWTSVGDPDFNFYTIYQDGNPIANPTTSSFSVTGLTPDTTYTFEISATDDSGNEGQLSSPVQDTTLANPPAPPNMGVQSTTITFNRLQGQNYFFDVTVVVVDESNTPLQGVTVSVNIAVPGGGSQSGNGVTGADGTVVITINSRTNVAGTYTASVTNAALTGYVFVPSANDQDTIDMP